ncbi:hypothetical protein M3182_09420 [Mesobacillus maritimus]|uniref:DUF6958 family protein n=1 Tax=Mesobacillus maritimus TaxID=1643336 RepID=UPI0020421D65|nr:hypothetical protein [Mesobacillus maritimus]MCM3585943.1 hypothetical protein [Mesobacillus maritimus]MCM3670396.1 hypothetical protein [Mesobacillus maritimus]
MGEKITLLNPQSGKQGATIRLDKYEFMKQVILEIVEEYDQISYKQLTQEVHKRLTGKFDGAITWYVTAVKLDLEAKGLLERFQHQKLQYLRKSTDVHP